MPGSIHAMGSKSFPYHSGQKKGDEVIAAERRLVKIFTGYNRNQIRSIGVCGVTVCAGATHLSVAIANYMESVLGITTVIIDYSKDQELYQMTAGRKKSEREICCFSGWDSQNMSLKDGYPAQVLDFGNDFRCAGRLFPLCDRRIILGSLSDWKSSSYECFLSVLEKSGGIPENFSFLSRNESRQAVRKLKKEYGITILPEPFFQDPYRIEQKHFGFFQKLIQ